MNIDLDKSKEMAIGAARILLAEACRERTLAVDELRLAEERLALAYAAWWKVSAARVV